MSKLRVGFVGLGNMGGDQARLLAAGDFDLTVFDVWEPAREAFENKARVAGSIAELAASADIVGICVRDDQQVCDTLQGPSGLLANLKAGSVVLVHSTVKPQTIYELAQEAGRRGVEILDAAVSRTRQTAEEAFVAVMIGGSEETLSRVRPVLDAYATDVFHAGPLGSGVAMKIVNNMITWTHVVTFAQAMRLATAGDVDLKVLLALLESNGNMTTTTRAFFENFFHGAPIDRTFQESQAGIGEKDLQLAAEFASQVGVSATVADFSKANVREAMLVGDDN